MSSLEIQSIHEALILRQKEAVAKKRADLASYAREQLLPKNDPSTKKMFQAIRAGRVPLPTTMYDEENKAFTSSITRIVQLIESAWSPILNRHQEDPPDWLRFQEKVLRPGEMPSIGKFFEN